MRFSMAALRLKNENPVLSYKRMRQAIGVAGMGLPLGCFIVGRLFSGLGLQNSISAYYYTNVRDVFVGILVCVGLFLLAYKGHERIDNIATSISGIAGIGIAFFPCYIDGETGAKSGVFQIDPRVSDILHFSFAGLFFILLALISLFLFTLSDKTKKPTKRKGDRNKIYIASGLVILVSLLAFLVLRIALGAEKFNDSPIIFGIEAVMLLAFGISWLTKGETILRDRD
ncbi:MAG TPA: DUF998 domain-containing protein [Rectinemataceae bacterium]|nr:DUF998 domain-containing protein [Rectinemataceae bacterium]